MAVQPCLPCRCLVPHHRDAHVGRAACCREVCRLTQGFLLHCQRMCPSLRRPQPSDVSCSLRAGSCCGARRAGLARAAKVPAQRGRALGGGLAGAAPRHLWASCAPAPAGVQGLCRIGPGLLVARGPRRPVGGHHAWLALVFTMLWSFYFAAAPRLSCLCLQESPCGPLRGFSSGSSTYSGRMNMTSHMYVCALRC